MLPEQNRGFPVLTMGSNASSPGGPKMYPTVLAQNNRASSGTLPKRGWNDQLILSLASGCTIVKIAVLLAELPESPHQTCYSRGESSVTTAPAWARLTQ